MTDKDLYAPFICPVNVPDFAEDTDSFTPHELGIYLRLLFSEWRNGLLPADISRLCRIARCSKKEFMKAWNTISVKFQDDGNGRLFNNRMEQVRQEQREFKEKKSKAGKMGMRSRYNK